MSPERRAVTLARWAGRERVGSVAEGRHNLTIGGRPKDELGENGARSVNWVLPIRVLLPLDSEIYFWRRG